MNKNKILVILIILILPVLLFSCRNYPAGVDVIGVWDGHIPGALADNTYFIEFNDDGTARVLGDLITAKGAEQEYKWNMTDYYLEMSVPFTNYKSLYAYEYSTDSLTLYMLDDTRMDEPWNTLIPGVKIVFSRAADGVSLSDLGGTN